MLDKPIDEIVFDESGKVAGVRSGNETAKCKQVFCDPSYSPTHVRKTGQVVRCICLMDHPLPNTKVRQMNSQRIGLNDPQLISYLVSGLYTGAFSNLIWYLIKL